MYTLTELKEFLALLLAVATANGLSGAGMASLLDTSHPSMARWLALARTLETGAPVMSSVYRFKADPVKAKLRKLEALNVAEGLYAMVARRKAADRPALLKAALTQSSV